MAWSDDDFKILSCCHISTFRFNKRRYPFKENTCKGLSGVLRPKLVDNRCIALAQWEFCRELVFYEFPLVVLHIITIISFHLWYILEGRVWISMKDNLFQFIFAPLRHAKWAWFSMNWCRMNGLCSNLHTTFKQAPKLTKRWKTTKSQPKIPPRKRITRFLPTHVESEDLPQLGTLSDKSLRISILMYKSCLFFADSLWLCSYSRTHHRSERS